jgi:hypothetical protein
MIAFWDKAPCSLVEEHQCFRGAYCLHHEGNEHQSTAVRLHGAEFRRLYHLHS